MFYQEGSVDSPAGDGLNMYGVGDGHPCLDDDASIPMILLIQTCSDNVTLSRDYLTIGFIKPTRADWICTSVSSGNQSYLQGVQVAEKCTRQHIQSPIDAQVWFADYVDLTAFRQ